MGKLVLATKNQGKIAEFERLMANQGSDITVLGLRDFPDLPDIEEVGMSFSANALLKAQGICAYTNLPALADDSGLCVDFLNGDPGIYSARWAGKHGDDLANLRKVLTQLNGVPVAKRGASFRCEVTLTFPSGHKNEGVEVIEIGELSGSITLEPRGTAGFGYDPIFQPSGHLLTFGELSHEAKDSISHRGMAFRAIAPKISDLL